MGQCEGICRTVKKNEEFKIDPLLQDNIDSKFYASPYYPKIVYLQLKLKKFLHSKKSLTLINKQNINVNINLNVNMPNKKDVPSINSTNANQPVLMVSKQKKSSFNASIMIPSVKSEFKESLIFSKDAFLKVKNASSNVPSQDPRSGPMDNIRRKYPKILEEDSSYEGEWKNGKRDGIGVLCWKSISKYMGEFAEDKVMGFGKLWHEDGDLYTGYWKDYQAHGVGIYTTAQNANYEGYWYEDKQSGFGIESWPKGSSYTGEYLEGNKEGYGLLNFENNGGYEGEFSMGCISGVGVFYFKDNRKYEGEWKNNKMQGFGIITWPDGKFYEGQFYDDRKEGFGVFYSHKKIYMGMWRNSLLEGDVIVIDGNKVKKQYWENGKASKQLPADKPIFFEQFVDEVIETKRKKSNNA